MQVWLFFQPGVGGDGIANLLEKSSNVATLDGVTDHWRVHRIVDRRIKFYAPKIDNIGCFRSQQTFDQTKNCLSSNYVDIVNQSLNCIVTSHDIDLQLLKNSDCQDTLTKNQIKVLLTSKDHDHAAVMSATKNLSPVVRSTSIPRICIKKFDYVLDTDLVKTDWNYLNNFCKNIGLELEHAEYLQYCDLLKGNRTFMKNNFNIEEWQSTITGSNVTYELVNVWQPTNL